MFKYISVFISLFFIQVCSSQVGINTTTPNAQLDIKSTNQASPSNTDGILIPKIDAFPVVNPTAAQQGMMVYLTTTIGLNTSGFYYWDNVTTSWISLKGASDADWFAVGGTSSPTSTNDNMYHLGNVAIGKNNAIYPFEVSATNEDINVNLDLLANTNGVERIGILNSISGTSNDDFSFLKNNIFGTGTGYKYGLNNVFNSTSNGAHYGLYNDFQNANTGKMGVYNNINGSGIGYYNFFQGPDNGAKYGSYTQFNSDYGSGNSDWIGHSVSFDYVTTIGNTGNKYGFAVAIPPAVGGGAHFGVYSYAGNLTIGYAGYFSGRVSIGDTTLDTDHYILPISRGTAGQIMQTDGSGNVTWQDPNAVMGNNFWKTTGNAGTNASTNFVGTTDNVDLVFKRNNIQVGKFSSLGIGFGSNSLFSNTTGSANSAFGGLSLYTNTTGSANSAFGSSSMFFNISGSNNSAFGSNSLRNNTSGFSNNAFGNAALGSNTTANANNAFGNNALGKNTTGNNNNAFGLAALYENIVGNFNVAFGNYSLQNNVANNNVASGYSSLRNNTSGSNNTGIGYNTAFSNTAGASLTSLGFEALYNNTNANRNTAIGSNALYNITTASFSTAVGANAFYSGNFSNSVAIGDASVISANNQIRMGDAGVTSIGGFANWTNVSDKRFKKNVQENVPGLSFITKLKPVTYSLDLDAIHGYLKTPDNIRKPETETEKKQEIQTGFIAQEVEKAAKELGFEFSGVDKPKNNQDYYGLRYAEFVVPLVKAVQEQQQIIEQQQVKINSLEERLAKIEALLNKH